MSWLFVSGGQSIGASALVLPMNIQFISFRTDWFYLRTVQGTLKSLLQHYSSKASILWCSAFFMVQLSHPYRTTGKNLAVGKLMSLIFNMLSRFVIAFHPRSKHLLILWPQSPSTVILELNTLWYSWKYFFFLYWIEFWQALDSDEESLFVCKNVHVYSLSPETTLMASATQQTNKFTPEQFWINGTHLSVSWVEAR